MFPKWRLRIWLLWLIVAGVLVFVLIQLSGRKPTARVPVVEVRRETLSASVTSNGKVEPVSPYVLRAQFPTFVTKVIAREGQHVRRGELLVTLDDTDIRAALAQAQEALLRAQEDLRIARAGGRADEAAQLDAALRRAELERDRLQQVRDTLQRLAARQAATSEEIARNAVDLARAQADFQEARQKKDDFARRVKLDVERSALLVARFREEVRSFSEQLRSARVTAPVEGTLYSLDVKLGDYVKVGDPLVSVADLHRIRVRAFIDEPDLGLLEPNQMVEISWDGLPARRWFGRTEQIPKEVVSRGQRSVGEVLCPVENDKLELVPNINVNVSVHVREKQNVLVVPRGAVRFEGTHRYVFVVADGLLPQSSRLQKREVKLGIASPTSFEVADGLREGEVVALPTDVELRDGMKVAVVRPE
jgi:HlyD family secretion protein